jgi:hypothetical protein
MITQDKMEAAMQFLADTDKDFADAKADLARAEIFCKRIRQRVFLTEIGTVAERNAKAETYIDVETADQDYIAALTTFEQLKARRQRAELVVEVWRSLNANQRRA